MSNDTAHATMPLEGRRLSTETKAATKTTEFFAYVAVVLAIIVTAFVVGDSAEGGEGDPFGAEHAMRYITFLTIGYMLARGLAKSGTREHHDAHNINA
ncbi:hypothetical protein [Ornithinicoccus halotolerans]|uniref:hypothetical protein n=1 Tax=Ornithinicoccus halotolerans TaxID=1748220 RepID=UPI001296EB77|nr:hypothetical protein [Ornithinicoccus halotolerans]